MAASQATAGAPAGGERPVAIVTGANAGIGFHVAGQLAGRGYEVVLACRSKQKAEQAMQEIKAQYGSKISMRVELLDLVSFASTRAFAAGFAKQHSRLELLVCNGGVNSASVSSAPQDQLSADGVDVLYQTNFLSHLLLILELMPLLQAARGRVVSVTSVMHRSASPADLELVRQVREPYVGFYGFSKLAQISASEELHRRFGATGVAFHTVNPGGVASNIWRSFPAWQRALFSGIMNSSEAAGSTVTEACVCAEGVAAAGAPAPAPKYWNGNFGASRWSAFEYWSPFSARGNLVPSDPSDLACNPAFAAKLWEESVAALCAAGVPVTPEGDITS